MSDAEKSLGRRISRVIDDGFFPTSPAATLREAIFSEILAGVLGSSPTTNEMDEIQATFEALKSMQSPRMVAQRRGKKVSDVVGKREDTASVGAEITE